MAIKKNGVGRQKITYKQSKMGQTNLLPSNRIGLLFTYNTDFDVDIDEQDFTFTGTQSAAGDQVGAGFGASAKGYSYPTIGGSTTGNPNEILVAAGWRSATVEQQINVSQEGALGFFDILDTVEHNVASNTFTVEKVTLRFQLLSRIGLAAFGKDVITSPRTNCYIYDPKEYQRGVNHGFLKLFGLHIQTNRFSAAQGQTTTEGITFRADRIQAVKEVPEGILADLKKFFPQIYSGRETVQEFEYIT